MHGGSYLLELDEQIEKLIMELYGTMHIIKALLDWHEIEMSLELEQDDDTGNLVDVFIFEDDEEGIYLELPSPMGQKIFRDFMGYVTVAQANDEDDSY